MPDTPAATPAPSTSPPSTASPTPPPSGAPAVQHIASVYDEFDSTDTKPTPPAPKKEAAQKSPPSKPSTPSTPADTSAQAADEKSAEHSTDGETQEKPTASTAATKPAVPKAADLRVAHEKLKNEHKALRAEVEKLRKAPPQDERVKQLTELLDTERQRRTKIEEELYASNVERDPKFKEQFTQPYIEAYTLGRQKTAALKITTEDGEVRQATEEDFDQIMQIGDENAAIDRAMELFGNKWQAVISYRNRVQELYTRKMNALEEHRATAGVREKEQAEARARQEQERSQRAQHDSELFHAQVKAMQERKPELFTPIEGDEIDAAVLKQGEQVADSLFNGVNPKTGKPYTPEGLVKLHAFVRNVVATHGHLLHKLKATEAKVTELETALAEYKESGSSQDSGRTGGETSTGSSLPGDAEFDEVEARSGSRW